MRSLRKRTTYHSAKRRRKRYRINAKRLIISLGLLALLVELIAVALTSPWFSVRKVKIEGNRLLPSARILALLELPPDSNIFLVKKQPLERRVARSPVVKDVRVRRRLPDTLIVQISERKRDLVLRTPTANYEVDASGVPFRTVAQPGTGVPVISCALQRRPVLGRPIREKRFLSARNCLLLVRAKKIFRVSEITVDPAGDLCLNDRDGFQVKLGRPEQLSEKLDKAALAVEQLPEFREHGEYIDVTCAEAPALKFDDSNR